MKWMFISSKRFGLDDVCRLLLSLTQPHELNFETDLTDSYFHSVLGWILINFKQNKNLVLNLPELITRSNAKFTGQFSLYRLKTPVSKVNSSA